VPPVSKRDTTPSERGSVRMRAYTCPRKRGGNANGKGLTGTELPRKGLKRRPFSYALDRSIFSTCKGLRQPSTPEGSGRELGCSLNRALPRRLNSGGRARRGDARASVATLNPAGPCTLDQTYSHTHETQPRRRGQRACTRCAVRVSGSAGRRLSFGTSPTFAGSG
jgi:hypothetical protein